MALLLEGNLGWDLELEVDKAWFHLVPHNETFVDRATLCGQHVYF